MEGILLGKHGINCITLRTAATYATVLHLNVNLTKPRLQWIILLNWELCKVEKTLILLEAAGKILIFC